MTESGLLCRHEGRYFWRESSAFERSQDHSEQKTGARVQAPQRLDSVVLQIGDMGGVSNAKLLIVLCIINV